MTPISPIEPYHEQERVAKSQSGVRSRLESREEEQRRERRRSRYTEATEDEFEVDTFEHSDP